MTKVKRILVVDDSKTQRMIMVRALAEFCCEIVGEAEDDLIDNINSFLDRLRPGKVK
ncbi:hypothetical protein [Magnetospirillum sp. 15-1]|uniref:hypothetical protein n=1 Tax=Magnetospirillum sp. 15-1 TaxID=1979370 RepID=UPI001481DDAB|nr:hypothetical protein [Magnetospirillum sp. 15-1]